MESKQNFAPQGGMQVRINGKSFSLSWDDFLATLMKHEDLSVIEMVIDGVPGHRS